MYQIGEYSHPVAPTKEEKDFPEDPKQYCNCYSYLKEKYFPDLPKTKELINGAGEAFGDIAVFYYPKSGLHHFAKVTHMGMGYFVIDEANYNHCQKGSREISFTDPNLIGFFSVNK